MFSYNFMAVSLLGLFIIVFFLFFAERLVDLEIVSIKYDSFVKYNSADRSVKEKI